MTLPPSRSILFPYTTLFRSETMPAMPHISGDVFQALRDEIRRLGGGLSPRAMLDRKSTRLNSSHQIISYAVFCLKKKKGRSMSKQVFIKINCYFINLLHFLK